MIEEQPLTHGTRLGIGSDLLGVHRHVFRVKRLDLGVEFLDFARVRSARGPAEYAGQLAQARIQHEIDQRKDDGEVEQPHPPAWQRIVVLREILVPDMAGGVGRLP